jgi:hypothetical protein
MPEKVKMFKCICGFLIEKHDVMESHVKIMDGVPGQYKVGMRHYEVE